MTTLAEHRLALASELVDDVELSRLTPEALLLKASRLARLVDAPEIQEWLSLELKGYPIAPSPSTAVAIKYGALTGRLIDQATQNGYWKPLAALTAYIHAMEIELQQLKLPNVQFAPSSANPSEYVGGVFGTHASTMAAPLTAALNRMQTLTVQISSFRGIVSRVMALLHDFVTHTYYELAFGGQAESIFEAHRKGIDALLAQVAPDALAKIPSIMDRLAAGDQEAVSQAMTTGRRVLHSFADAVEPPSDQTIELDGKNVELTAPLYLNRLRHYVAKRCDSGARRTRLRQTLANLNDRFGAATHADVSAAEARALFVSLYVTLGELLSLGPREATGTGPGKGV